MRHLPAIAHDARVQHIVDRYIEGTTVRLRQVRDNQRATRFKLTQKLANGASGAFRGFITTMYLAEAEYDIFAMLPAKTILKTRHSLPPFGVDVFEGELAGLILAEAEFDSAEAAALLQLPPFLCAAFEVTSDPRFDGGSLAASTRRELELQLAEFGIRLNLD